jgi:hypothetical protein
MQNKNNLVCDCSRNIFVTSRHDICWKWTVTVSPPACHIIIYESQVSLASKFRVAKQTNWVEWRTELCHLTDNLFVQQKVTLLDDAERSKVGTKAYSIPYSVLIDIIHFWLNWSMYILWNQPQCKTDTCDVWLAVTAWQISCNRCTWKLSHRNLILAIVLGVTDGRMKSSSHLNIAEGENQPSHFGVCLTETWTKHQIGFLRQLSCTHGITGSGWSS